MRSRVIALCGLIALAAMVRAAAAQGADVRGIWAADLGPAGRHAMLVQEVQAAGLDTIVLPVFYDGRTVYPSRVFPQQPRYVGTDPVAPFIAEAHRRGLRVFAAIDLLRWQSSRAASPALANHPEWIERTAEGRDIGDAAGAAGAFVSPAPARVRTLLTNLGAELATRYEFDGVVMDYARWSRLDFLGYADADRKACLQELQCDPLDVDLLGYATPPEMITALVDWQERRITEAVAAFAEAFRRVRRQGMIIAVVEPRYYEARTANPARQNWRAWLGQSWLDAVAPDGISYADPARARDQLRAAAGVEGAPLVALIRGSNALPAAAQVQAISSLGLRGFILWAHDSPQQRRQVLLGFGAR